MNRNWFLTLIVNIAICCALSAQAQDPPFIPAPGSPAPVGEGSGHLVFADVNRDGKTDLIAQHLQQRVVTVLLGR